MKSYNLIINTKENEETIEIISYMMMLMVINKIKVFLHYK
jgi:hypothetical protein